MLDIFSVLIFLALFLFSLAVLKRPKGLIPGPLTLPFIGSVFFLNKLQNKRVHLSLLDASKVYGEVFSFGIGPQRIVVLNSWDAIQQAFVKQADVFSDRPNFLPRLQLSKPPAASGIIFHSHNHQWKTLRRFTLQTLRDFGVGKTSIEEKIAVEIKAASDVIDAVSGKPLEITPVLQKVVGNVIYGIIFGKRFDFDEPDIDMVRKMSNIAVTGDGFSSVTFFFPLWVSRLFFRRTHKEDEFRKKNVENIKTFIFDQIKKHEDSFDDNNIRDFVDLYIQASRDSKENMADVLTKDSILRVIHELFIAGAETTYNTLDWAFLFMSEYPEIQEKCFKEIEEVVGDKYIEYADRVKLPYCDATISEVQRHANIAPLAVLHSASEDTTLFGYNIPKRTIIMPNLYSALMDPKHWDEPAKFKPERFIDNEGRMMKHDPQIPFGTGPRVCLGEPLARMELFLVFANLLQRFRFFRENDHFRHTMEARPNRATSSPVSYNLRIQKR